MPRRKAPTVSLEEARARFEEWRSNRSGKARIPAELWSAAVEVARKEGINRTARQLHVAWDDLKRRMGDDGGRSTATGVTSVCGTVVTTDTVGTRMHS
jgi:hypothetical protein